MSLISFLFGHLLANKEAEGRKIGVLEGIPAMGLDGLGSAAYGPEAMLTVLAITGASGLSASWWEVLLHTHHECRLRTSLLRHGGADIAVIGVPWQLQSPEPGRAIAEEKQD